MHGFRSGRWSMDEVIYDEGLFDLLDNLTHIINISQSQPKWLAKPIYGVAAPVIILLTLITNTLVVLVLSHKNLRTPTNYILLSMALTELLTGLSTSPWFLYYYTFGGLETDEREGLPDFWCKSHAYFAVHFPTIFHTAAIWLTVFLAVQRYIYVCMPSLVIKYCNPRLTLHWILAICFVSMVSELPAMTTHMWFTYTRVDGRRICLGRWIDAIDTVFGIDNYNAVSLWARVLFVHILPCALLIIFTTCLFRTIGEADRKRSIHVMPSRRHKISTTTTSSNRLMHATTRMLVVVIAIFLIIEIPVALIFVFHFIVVYFQIFSLADYVAINNLLILRNFMIILTYPLNFAIYFGMSSSFKLQFRQMFSRKILYIASPSSNENSNWRPRFSVQLVDIHKIRSPSHIFSRKNTARKVNLQCVTQTSTYVEEGLTDELL